MCHKKKAWILKDYKNYLKATELKNKISQLERNKVNTESFRESHNEFIKDYKLILKTHQRFKSKRHDFFTEEINNVNLNSNDDKRIKSIDSVETCIWNEKGFTT